MQTTALIELIYAAVEEPSRWIVFLEAFTQTIHAKMSLIWITPVDSSLPRITASFGLPAEVQTVMALPNFRDPWISRVDLSTVPVGKILRSNEICPDEIVVNDEWYQRACLPYGFHYGGGVTLEISDTMSAGMAANRQRSAGPLTDAELDAWNSLVPHLMRAVRLIGRELKLLAERDGLMSYFDDLGQGMILATSSSLVAAANAQANAILKQGIYLAAPGGHLQAGDPATNRDLSEALLATSRDLPPEPVQLPILRPGYPPLLASILPTRKLGEIQISVSAPTALIYLTDPAVALELDPAPLRQLYSLTAAEARLACLLATGNSLSEAAELLNVSLNTVRTHLQRTLEKTGMNRQAALVTLVLKVSRRSSGGTNHPNA